MKNEFDTSDILHLFSSDSISIRFANWQLAL